MIGAIRDKRLRAAALGYSRAPRSDAINITGQIFNRLTARVRLPAAATHHRDAMWLCECSCGRWRVVRGTRLRNGEIKSCGCYRREVHIPWLRRRRQERAQ